MRKLIDKIKSRGYWKVVIRPAIYKDNLVTSLDKCKEIVKQSKVSLRGWDYPHIDSSSIKIAGNNSVHSFCDWSEWPMFEYWKFYQTGQFVHYFSMREDLRMTEDKKNEVRTNNINKFLSIISTIYSVTEVFEFASRIVSKIDNSDSFEIIIELHDAKDRMLFFWDAFRSLRRSYICEYDPIIIKKILTKEEIISKPSEIALDVAIEIFKRFNWTDVNRRIFVEDQKKFFERRL